MWHSVAMQPLAIRGASLFTPQIHGDDRGLFLEWFRADRLAESSQGSSGGPADGDPGWSLELKQANCSVSDRGVLRGVHFADVPPGQAKYVTCISGAILDVVVDLRVGSPTFGRWEAVRLDDETRQGLYIAEGLGHAFLALSERTTIVYLCSEGYSPGREHAIHPLDPDLGIDWPLDVLGVDPQLSSKDSAAPSLAEALDSGLLPRYQQCLDYYEKLRIG
ncbi:MAG: dTDP-4-dehydrorhamnose 3,5-epimerase [Streptosporangiaceae bacterium]|jgi:dTDP-4-dehydrorhamnose 3,5-epimerase|nr:dTDP-4-dehydrorhamnose 3,5-epimerase [Streptosporangiaceae bacterium]